MARPSSATIVRNAAAHGSLAPSMLGGVAMGAINRDRQLIAEYGVGNWIERLLAFTGVELSVADQVASRGGLVQGGTVDVAVLPPVPVKGWTARDLDQRVAGVRRQFVDTLGDWPGGPS